ncbi:myelin-associated oligodendrocyte basic protein [Trifolium repens]|nr:myelin-associated oligodendrocyte basic protein [Trifolium repens]
MYVPNIALASPAGRMGVPEDATAFAVHHHRIVKNSFPTRSQGISNSIPLSDSSSSDRYSAPTRSQGFSHSIPLSGSPSSDSYSAPTRSQGFSPSVPLSGSSSSDSYSEGVSYSPRSSKREKFDEEKLVNFNNIKRQSTSSQMSTNGFTNEYIVITILASVKGEFKIPSINGSGNLKKALQKLGSIPSSKLLAVEVSWTPQNENDTPSEREFLQDYPLLRLL